LTQIRQLYSELDTKVKNIRAYITDKKAALLQSPLKEINRVCDDLNLLEDHILDTQKEVELFQEFLMRCFGNNCDEKNISIMEDGDETCIADVNAMIRFDLFVE
jgi:hypothetical protein